MQKRALVMSYSTITKDPRVLRQVNWLTSDGWLVDTVGWGQKLPDSKGQHFSVRMRPLFFRLFVYVFAHGRWRYSTLVEKCLPADDEIGEVSYDLVIANDLDFLPWCTDVLAFSDVVTPNTKWHVDLHEYFGDQGHGVSWKILFSRYHKWLFPFAKSDLWSSRSTVAEGIATLYKSFAGFTEMKITRNAPPFSGLPPLLSEDTTINLVYHGNADLGRGLQALVAAVKDLDKRFNLNLLLVGDPRSIKRLEKIVDQDGISDRVFFHPPVSVQEIPSAINRFDLEVIFYPPLTENLRLALPNKFFEAIQAGIGVVIGHSPSMETIVQDEQLGLIVDGWTQTDLVNALNGLDKATVNSFKQNAGLAALKFNSDVEGKRFLSEIVNA